MSERLIELDYAPNEPLGPANPGTAVPVGGPAGTAVNGEVPRTGYPPPLPGRHVGIIHHHVLDGLPGLLDLGKSNRMPVFPHRSGDRVLF